MVVPFVSLKTFAILIFPRLAEIFKYAFIGSSRVQYETLDCDTPEFVFTF